ncbi:hypothetical protein EHS13_12550 [Paenibacillus psychroresistens]|uniref:DUF4381 domain-containing protein n=1 Tax=Paenibacillus psychroresistens TaxID=1778678 RepID=A0A6B8RJ64_9BACL|nr:hypothetical protein [Paenibacillus psychroresistens]QGQ95655.1 hypothetical protein EHS13_12550 [Paenibacillus psychroresistens]
MKKAKITLIILFLTLFFMPLAGQVQAEARSIYVGDLIELKISTQEFSKDAIIDKFKDFEIVHLTEDKGVYLLTLRSFEPSEKKVRLGNKEIAITIKSTLDEIQRDGIFEGDLTPEKPGFQLNWQYAIYALLLIFLLSGGIYYFRRYYRKKNKALITPFQHFINQMKGMSEDDDQYFVKMTFYFKTYIEAAYSCMIRGKTSSEIIDEISLMPGLQESAQEIRDWLEESNRLKFSGVVAFEGAKQHLHGHLVDLVGRINEHKGSEL